MPNNVFTKKLVVLPPFSFHCNTTSETSLSLTALATPLLMFRSTLFNTCNFVSVSAPCLITFSSFFSFNFTLPFASASSCTTDKRSIGSRFVSPFIITAKSTSSCIFSISTKGISSRSCSLTTSGNLSASDMAKRLPAFAVTNEPIIQVTNIRMIVPFKTFSSINPILYPIRITAMVAAACDVLKPKITFRCVAE